MSRSPHPLGQGSSGCRPEQVDEICITRVHGEHVGGLARGGERVFPNAVARAAGEAGGCWLDSNRMAQAPESATGSCQAAMASLVPYLAHARAK